MRRIALPLAALVILAACSGDSAGGVLTLPDTTTTELPVQTVATTEAPPATQVVTTEATTTSSTTTTSTSTTIEDVPLTILEPATTVIPADVDETFAEAFAVYQEAWLVRQESARSPSDPAVRDRIRDLYVDPFLTELLDGLDEQAAGGFANIESSDREPPFVTFVDAIATTENGRFAEFTICEVLTERVVDVASGDVIFDEILALSGQVRMTLSDAGWRVAEEISTKSQVGTQCTE